jgi:hypothetical protein
MCRCCFTSECSAPSIEYFLKKIVHQIVHIKNKEQKQNAGRSTNSHTVALFQLLTVVVAIEELVIPDFSYQSYAQAE